MNSENAISLSTTSSTESHAEIAAIVKAIELLKDKHLQTMKEAISQLITDPTDPISNCGTAIDYVESLFRVIPSTMELVSELHDLDRNLDRHFNLAISRQALHYLQCLDFTSLTADESYCESKLCKLNALSEILQAEESVLDAELQLKQARAHRLEVIEECSSFLSGD